MTTGGSDVAIVISARDRASPVMQRVGRNLSVMQRNVVGLSTAMGVMDRSTGGILRSLTPLIGAFSVVGLATTGMGLALSFGLKKLKETQDEQRKTGEASQKLRNNFMLSGFSATSAASQVNELKGNLSALAFQTLPKLDFEMQDFIFNMDTATKSRFNDMVKTLTDQGVPAVDAMNAIGEAMQGNFIPITALLKQPINTFAEFAAAMAHSKETVTISKDPILRAFEELVSGSGTLEERLTRLFAVLQKDTTAAAESMTRNGATIRGILLGLSSEQSDLLTKTIQVWSGATGIPGLLQTSRHLLQPIMLGLITDVRMVYDNHAALRDQVIRVSVSYAERWIMMADATNQQANRIVEDTERVLAAQARLTAADRLVPLPPGIHGPPSPRESLVQIGGIGGPVVTETMLDAFRHSLSGGGGSPFMFQHGGIVTRPTNARVGEVPEMIAPLSRLPGLLEGIGGGGRPIHITVQIGERVVRDMVVDVLNDEVSLREPSLGLG